MIEFKEYRDSLTEEFGPNLTPMIDMTFLLVVFFMLTIDLSQKEYVALELPYARAGVEDKETPIPRLTVNLLSSGDIVFKGRTTCVQRLPQTPGQGWPGNRDRIVYPSPGCIPENSMSRDTPHPQI